MGSNDSGGLPSVGSWLDLWTDLGEQHQQLALSDLLVALKSREWAETATSFWGRFAKFVHFREQTLRSMDSEKLRVRLQPHVKSVMTNSAWSLLFYLYWQKHHGDLMRCFLDGLGIDHEGGIPTAEKIAPPAEEKITSALADACRRFLPVDVRRLVRVLIVNDAQNWAFLGRAYLTLVAEQSTEQVTAPSRPSAPTPEPPTDVPSDEFTTLDRVLIKSIVDTVSSSEGALDADELEDLVETVVGLNSSRQRTYFHLGFMDTMVSERKLDFEHREFNDLRREWYLSGALTGLLRRRDSEAIKAVLASRSDDFRRAAARLGGPGAAMARTLVQGLIEIGRVTEAALLIRGQAADSGAFSMLVTALKRAEDLLRDNDLTSAGTLLNALEEAQLRLARDDERGTAFRRQLSRRLGQYHQAQGNFKQATSLFERLQKEGESEDDFDIVTDLGLIRAGFKSLVEVRLPADKEQRGMLIAALKRGATQFERAISAAPTRASNAQYALAVLKYLERSQARNPETAEGLAQQALRHAQEALDAMRMSDSADAYERLGLMGQCLFIQSVLQMQSLDPVDARAAAAAWDQITDKAGTFPSDDLWGLIEAAEVIDPLLAARIAESVWKFRPSGASELIQFSKVILNSGYLQQQLLGTARQEGQSKAQQWAIWTRLIPILLEVGDIDVADEGLDALQRLAEEETFARQFDQYLSDTANYDPAWDETDVKWAKVRIARRLGEDQACGDLLRSLFFSVRDSNPMQAKQILDLCADWRIDGTHYLDLKDRTVAARPDATQVRVDDRLKGGEGVRILFVGGNEIQEQYDRDIQEIIRKEWPGVSIAFRHTGWSSNWGRELDSLKREASTSDCVVLMTMMRTTLGRRLREGLTKPWLSCAATGRSGIVVSIREAARVGLQTRTNGLRH